MMTGSWARLFASALAIAGIGGANAILISEEQLLNQTYDYIIVGGGTSGLTVANRLTENGKKTVLVVEYGYFDDDPNILLPGGAMRGSLRRMYNITSLPILGLNNRTAGVSAGAVVGGGSAVNGMFFDRGAKSDYDAWEKLGNTGWGWKDILPYFKKSVTFTPPTEEDAKKYGYTWDVESAYGGKGPVQVSFPPYQFPGLDYVWRAWKEFGVNKPQEGANGEAIGAIHAPSALDPVTRTRSYARTAHYEPYKNRTNYHLLTGYQVTEIRFVRDLRAVGVNVVKRGKDKKIAIQAHRETIIAAGALWTPWLLQRSGIGPRQVLEAAGIPVKKDMPGVGANFQDHAVGYGAWTWTKAGNIWPTPMTLQTNQTFAAEARKEYEKHRTGPLTIATGNQAAFLPLKTVATNWESIVDTLSKQNYTQYLPKSYDANLTEGYRQQHLLTLDLLARNDSAAYEVLFNAGPVGGAALMRPLSRGTVNINPANPSGPPLVDYRTFSNPVDVQQAIQSIFFARRVNAVSTFAELGPVELSPGINVTGEDALSRHVRLNFNPSFAHPSGTASMMPEQYGGVVRPDLRIWQTRKLSVVDASIMPFIPATHICTTVYAVAERAAQYIKERTDWDGP